MKRLFSKLVPAKFRKSGPSIPVVRMSGVITASAGPFQQNISMANVANQLNAAFNVKQAPAVAIIVNSPGGSPVQSRLIYKRIRDLAREKNKTVYVFCEDVAASGGYFIACAGDEIIADPSSIVGSIGVIYAGFGFAEAIDKIGVERRVYTTGKNKSTLDPFKPAQKEDIARITQMGADIHEIFIDHVKESRGNRLSDDKDLFTGAFWTGARAKDLGLVDHIGDIRSFLQSKFGENVEMKLVTAPRSLLGRKVPGGVSLGGVSLGGVDPQAIAQAATSGALSAVEERAMWGRFGL